MAPNLSAALLMRWSTTAPTNARLSDIAHELAARWPETFERIDGHRAIDASRVHLYAWVRDQARLTDSLRDAATRLADARPGAEIVRLSPLEQRTAASAGRDAPFHYVVETDAEGDDAEAVRAWYDNEHLDGLAACEGTVRARRLTNLDGGPRSFACYDLVSLDVLESPAWLAVRATDWASRVRPLFRNTRRTRFERVFNLDGNPHE